MSAPDPDDITLPRDPHDYSVRRRGFGLAFWAAMVFGLLCILAGIAIDRYGPKLFPAHPAPAPVQRGAANDLQPAQLPPPPIDAVSDGPAPIPAAPADVASLTARLDRLDAADQRLRQAAAEALAAADVGQAAQTSRPFADQLSSLQRLLPDSADLRTLAGYAATGAPSRASLAMQLDGLSAPGRDAAATWRAEAERRIEIDRLTAAIRTSAERDLAQPQPSGAPT